MYLKKFKSFLETDKKTGKGAENIEFVQKTYLGLRKSNRLLEEKIDEIENQEKKPKSRSKIVLSSKNKPKEIQNNDEDLLNLDIPTSNINQKEQIKEPKMIETMDLLDLDLNPDNFAKNHVIDCSEKEKKTIFDEPKNQVQNLDFFDQIAINDHF